MVATRERWPDGNTAISSPTATGPPTTGPEKPRKFWSGRQTHCTGRRKPPVPASRRASTASRCCSRFGPSYQGVDSNACSMLSPLSADTRSEEHTSELQSLMRISYAVFCLKKKIKNTHKNKTMNNTQHQTK